MIVEILATGDEIRSGAAVDTNSAFIARQIEAAGLEIRRHHCIGDDLAGLAALMTTMGQRVDVAIVTGGLGPTADDLTASAAARAAEVALELHAESWQRIQDLCRARGYKLFDTHRKQALLPRGSQVVPNPVGSAPGFEMSIGRGRFFFLPGVPMEMKRMMADTVIPRIRNLAGFGHLVYRTETISCFGLAESALAAQLAALPQRFPDLQLGFRTKFPEVHVKLYGRHEDAEFLSRRLVAARQFVLDHLGSHVVSATGESMAAAVGRLLTQKGSTLGVAESCTGGLIAHELTSVPGSSAYFLFSGVTYANAAKSAVLDVPLNTIEQYGAVSEQTVRAMAEGARRVAGADYGLATSGIAGPDGGTPQKPVGTVWIGLAGPQQTTARRYRFKFGRRKLNITMFAAKALDLLRLSLISDIGPDPDPDPDSGRP